MEIDIPMAEVPARPLLGNAVELKRDFLGTMSRWFEQYGDLVRFRLGRTPFYLISSPALAEQVLIKQSETFVKPYDPARPYTLCHDIDIGADTAVARGRGRFLALHLSGTHITALPNLLDVDVLGGGGRVRYAWYRHIVSPQGGAKAVTFPEIGYRHRPLTRRGSMNILGRLSRHKGRPRDEKVPWSSLVTAHYSLCSHVAARRTRE